MQDSSAVEMAALTTRLKLLIAAVIIFFVLYIFTSPDSSGYLDMSNVKDPRSRSLFNLNPEDQEEKHADDQNIIAREKFKYTFDLGGHCFNEQGHTAEVKSSVTSLLIHNFSPYVERETAKRFIDPAHSQVYYANSPAIKWYHGKLVMVARIWLERERYEAKQNWPANHFADNWLYTQKYDRHMKPISNASIMGVPLPKQWWVGDGPIEPRLCVVKNKLFVTFNAAMAYNVGKYIDYTVMWDYEEGIPIIPQIKGGSPMINATAGNEMPRDKHWMALVQKDELYFVHNLDPLRIMHCTLQGYCEFIHNEVDKQKGLIFDDHISHLRGGTPFELYKWPYYISVAHSTMYKKSNGHRYYTVHLVVLCVKPYRVVYVSDDIKIHPEIYNKIPIVRYKYIEDGFIFPVGLIIENEDTISLGVHVSDHSSVIIRVRGIRNIMNKVMAEDIKNSPKHGPPIKYLHKYVHDTLQNSTNMLFKE